MKKILIFLIILGIVIGIIVGISNNEKEVEEIVEEPTIIENTIKELNLSLSEIDTINPLETKNRYVAYMLNLIYEPLFTFDYENQVEPSLAVKASPTNDKTWIIKLRENVKWHDGTPFTSEDVKYTINLISSGDIDSAYANNVKNISAIDIIDLTTLVISLNEDEPYLFSKLTFPIVPKNSFNGTNLNNGAINELIGTGPYKYNSSSEKEIILENNNDWWQQDEEINLEKINIKLYPTYGEAIKGFKSSEVDLILTSMNDWKEKFGFIGINSYKFENSEYEVIIPNTKNVALGENAVRKAIQQAINRENIVEEIYNENAIIHDVPTITTSRYENKNIEYNIENAKQLLINAGWTQNKTEWIKNGKKLNFVLIVPKNDKEKLKVAERIKQDLKDLSINISISELTWDRFQTAIKNDKFDLALASIDIKNEYQIQDMVETDNEYNLANYTNPEVDTLISKLKSSAEETYTANLKEFNELYKAEMPYIGLYFKACNILTNKSVKGDYEATYINPYRNITTFCK